MQRHYRDRTSTIRVPRPVRELQVRVYQAADEMSQKMGRAATPRELALHLDVGLETVIQALQAAYETRPSSLDETRHSEDAGSDAAPFADTIGDVDPELDLVENRESLMPLLDRLPERERKIVLLRFYGNMTQTEIAKRTGISQMHVSRLLSSTLAQLRRQLVEEGLRRRSGFPVPSMREWGRAELMADGARGWSAGSGRRAAGPPARPAERARSCWLPDLVSRGAAGPGWGGVPAVRRPGSFRPAVVLVGGAGWVAWSVLAPWSGRARGRVGPWWRRGAAVGRAVVGGWGAEVAGGAGVPVEEDGGVVTGGPGGRGRGRRDGWAGQAGASDVLGGAGCGGSGCGGAGRGGSECGGAGCGGAGRGGP